MKYLWCYLSLRAIVLIVTLVGIASFSFLRSQGLGSEKSETPGLSVPTAWAVRQNSEAIVHIEVTVRKEGMVRSMPFVFQDFFEEEAEAHGSNLRWQDTGTGMFIDDQGHILTNYGVVGGSGEISVTQVDRRKYPAHVIGADPMTNLAVLQLLVDQPIRFVTFGDSDGLDVGQRVIAIGFRHGNSQTITQGLINAVPRPGIKDPRSYKDLIQTDNTISISNCGGPLLNIRGKVVGVNIAVASRGLSSHRAGFAIPGNAAACIAKQLVAHGKVERGYLGTGIAELPHNLSEPLDPNNPKGALISEVIKGGPADRAGIKKGDVVIKYGDKPILNSVDLLNRVAESPPGEEVEITIYRHGNRRIVAAKVERFPDFLMEYRLGLEAGSVTCRTAQQYGLNRREGVVVVTLHPDSPLAEIGMEVNDLILEIEGRSVKGPEDFRDHVSALKPGQRVTILGLDHRTGRTGYIRVVVP